MDTSAHSYTKKSIRIEFDEDAMRMLHNVKGNLRIFVVSQLRRLQSRSPQDLGLVVNDSIEYPSCINFDNKRFRFKPVEVGPTEVHLADSANERNLTIFTNLDFAFYESDEDNDDDHPPHGGLRISACRYDEHQEGYQLIIFISGKATSEHLQFLAAKEDEMHSYNAYANIWCYSLQYQIVYSDIHRQSSHTNICGTLAGDWFNYHSDNLTLTPPDFELSVMNVRPPFHACLDRALTFIRRDDPIIEIEVIAVAERSYPSQFGRLRGTFDGVSPMGTGAVTDSECLANLVIADWARHALSTRGAGITDGRTENA